MLRRLALSPFSLSLPRRLLTTAALAPAVTTRALSDGVVELRLSRPQSRNALSVAVMTEMRDALNEIDAAGRTGETRVLVLSGEGPAFSSGHDLKEMRGIVDREGSMGDLFHAIADPREADLTELFTLCSQVMEKIPNLSVPVIAKVDGVATAAGCQLVVRGRGGRGVRTDGC